MAYYQGSTWEASPPVQLKPMHVVSATSLNSTYSEGYNPVPHAPLPDYEGAALIRHDQKLKRQIRVLKFVSRVLTTITSATTMAPLLMTLVKFLQTRNVYYDVNGQERTAWAKDTIAWYTYMYTAVSATSFLLNLVTVIAYCRGVKAANRADKVQSAWHWAVLAGEVVVWAVSTAVYRYGKEPVDGHFRDLWGWTCSATADALQSELTGVNFAKYCNVQATSFYSGVVNTVMVIISGVVMFMTLRRRSSKKRVEAVQLQAGNSTEPLRKY